MNVDAIDSIRSQVCNELGSGLKGEVTRCQSADIALAGERVGNCAAGSQAAADRNIDRTDRSNTRNGALLPSIGPVGPTPLKTASPKISVVPVNVLTEVVPNSKVPP